MIRIKGVLILIMSLFLFCLSQGQTPQKMNYQAVARDSSGTLIANQGLDLRFSILQNNLGGAVVFQEEMLNIPANAYGLFNVHIGTGTPIQGLFSNIQWGANSFYLKVELKLSGSGGSYIAMGTAQIISVAYALFAQDVANKDDADSDPANELQTLTISADSLSISNGNTVKLPDQVYDGDSSVTNELQVLSLSGDTLFLSNGGFAVLPNDGDWTKSNTGVYNTSDSIGIGTATPSAYLDIEGSFQYRNGTEGQGRFLVSDTIGNASWDTLVDPFTFAAPLGNWADTGAVGVDNVYCFYDLVLTQKSLVVVTANAHLSMSTNGAIIMGIAFPGETLIVGPNTVFSDIREAQYAAVPQSFADLAFQFATSRSMILEPGTYRIKLLYTALYSTGSVTMYGANLTGHVIPFN